ncbi:hypothetical protein GW535_17770 (plasmid) [Piscirickettsia salmonis]|nr:hypothetical protein GW535_17770 [Piscirickettsia salmonis]
MLSCIFRAELSSASAEVYPQALLAPRGARNVHVHISVTRGGYDEANDSWSEIYFTRKVIMPMCAMPSPTCLGKPTKLRS